MIPDPLGAARRARALVAECLLAVPQERPCIAALAAGPVNWVRVASLARAAMAEESVAHALLGAGVALDGGGREVLRDAYENAAAKNAMLLRDAAEIQEALGRAGVGSVALKGAALVAAHYPSVGARHVGDLDLLVDPDDLARVRDTFAALGMNQPVPDRGGPPAGRVHLGPWVTRNGFSCEVHVRLPGAPPAAAAGVRARSRRITWRGYALFVPSPEDLAGIASAHALGQHGWDARFRARLVSDLAVLEAAEVDRDEARRCHGAGVDAAFRLLEAVRAGRHAAVVPLLLDTRAGGVACRAAGLAAGLSRARRARALRSLFFPDRAALARRYGVRESARLLPLLWLYRPLGAFLRVLTGR